MSDAAEFSFDSKSANGSSFGMGFMGMGVPNGLAKIHTHVEENDRRMTAPGTPGRTTAPGTPGRTTAPGTPGRTTAPGTPGRTTTPGTPSAADVCIDDSVPTVRAKTLDELHALQRKRSAPTTPKDVTNKAFALSEEERLRMQLQSISCTVGNCIAISRAEFFPYVLLREGLLHFGDKHEDEECLEDPLLKHFGAMNDVWKVLPIPYLRSWPGFR